uniref:Uncharacterized protein n=1 Tax=Arundo donax TaxID=35708 RepID=A0A0A9CEH0_ARUDO
MHWQLICIVIIRRNETNIHGGMVSTHGSRACSSITFLPSLLVCVTDRAAKASEQ